MSKAVKGLLSPVTSLFGGGKMPEIKSPAAMPTPDGDAVAAARRRKIAEMQNRSGRVSTILSSDERLGG